MSDTTTKSTDNDDGGRFGRTPYRPEDLKEQFGTVDSGRLDVICPGCGTDWYPTSKCCVSRYAGDPFCPQCGTDFRAEEVTFQPKVKVWNVEDLTNRKGSGTDVTEQVRDAMEKLDESDDYAANEAYELLHEAFGSLEPETRVATETDGSGGE